jgi:hypothetical protein
LSIYLLLALVFGMGGFFVWVVYRTMWREERRRLEKERAGNAPSVE